MPLCARSAFSTGNSNRPRIPDTVRAIVRGCLFALATIALCGCGAEVPVPANVTEVVVSDEVIEDFLSRRGAINAQRERNPPPAAALTAGGDADGIVGVVLWSPETTFSSLGFRDGDKVVAIDQDTTDSIYSQKWQGYGRYAKPTAFGTDKYSGFVADVFRRRSGADSTLLILHRRNGRERSAEPIGIRLLFTD